MMWSCTASASDLEMLAKAEHGRRALIVFSDGEDNSSAHNMMETLETAQSNDVVLYGIRYRSENAGQGGARPESPHRVQRRRGQFQRAQHDGNSGDGAEQ